MFAKTIVLSDAFLDMPLSARCLYFTFGMLADDDGFINSPKSIMRQCGATDDDLKILVAKKFIIPFESGVIVIKHWRINNYLRSDRKIDTKYIDERAQLSIEENGSYAFGIPTAYQVSTACLPSDNQVPTTCQASGIPRLGKGSLVQDNNNIVFPNGNTQVTQETASPSLPDCPFTEIMDLFNKICVSFPRILGIDGERKRAVAARWRTYKSLDPFRELFGIAEDTPFLKGNNNRNWVANFDWMMKPTNFVKILEHRYDGGQQTQQQAPQSEYDRFMSGLMKYCDEEENSNANSASQEIPKTTEEQQGGSNNGNET